MAFCMATRTCSLPNKEIPNMDIHYNKENSVFFIFYDVDNLPNFSRNEIPAHNKKLGVIPSSIEHFFLVF